MITGRKERAVLTVLVAWAGDVVSTGRLTDALWGERPPASSAKVLHNLVLRLRKVLGAEVIETRPGGYVLRSTPDAVDAQRFERLTREGRRRAAIGEWEAAAEALSTAEQLWRGPPLGELGDWSPGCGEAARLQEQHRCVVEELAEAELACGRHREWVARLETLVHDEPLRERRWALLMLALYRCGRQAEALRAFQRARFVLGELGLEPGPELVLLERDVSLHREPSFLAIHDASSCDDPIGNLARPATELVGRVAELQHRLAELATRRLVTLTGVGGVGKTRLATELGWSMIDAFPGGVWMVELAPRTDTATVVAAVASTLSVQPQPGAAMQSSIVDWLRGRRLLLILDNCEHVLAPVSKLVDAIVTGCPTVTVLVTSREPLGVPGEQVRVVPPLEPASEGVELFCDRARAADGTFTPRDDDRAAIMSICRRLDGIPLAIELTAARIRSSTPADLLSRLNDRFRLLRRAGPGGPARHHTLRATVDWSYQLLDEDERLLFDRVSVFAGGFELAAAEAVCSDRGLERADIAGVLDSLVDKSMVIAERSGHGVRYGLLETLREFGQERLSERGEDRLHRHHHLCHYIKVATQAYTLWASPQQVDADRFFRREWDNLRVALGWSVSTANLPAANTLVAATGPHAWCRLNQEHADWAALALTLSTAGRPASPATYGWAAYWAFISGNYEHAITHARQGIDAAPAPEHPDTIWCWGMLAWALLASGRGAEARQPTRSAHRASASIVDPFAGAWVQIAVIEDALTNEAGAVDESVRRYAQWAEEIGAPSLLARAAFYQGQLQLLAHDRSPGAIAFYSHGLDIARRAGDSNNEGKNLAGIISAATQLRTPDTATIAREALSRLYDTRHWVILWAAMNKVARWFAAVGPLEAAAIIYGHLDAHQPVWDVMDAGRIRSHGIELAREHPDADTLMAKGAAMTSDQIVNYVLDQLADFVPGLSTTTGNTNTALASPTR